MKNAVPTVNTFNNLHAGDKTEPFGFVKVTAATFSFFSKTLIWLIFLGGTMFVLQLASLEICSHARIFPLYGFYFTNLLYIVFLFGIYRISRSGFALPTTNIAKKILNLKGHIISKISFPHIRLRKSEIKQIPAMLLIVRHCKEFETKKKNKVSVK